MSGFFIGIDVGGTNLKAGLTDETGRLLAAARRPLDFRGAETFAADLADLAAEVLSTAGAAPGDAEGVGIGLPGAVSGGEVLYTTNIPLERTDLAALFRRRLDLPVLLGNDADCAAVGEYFQGAGRGLRDFVVLTLGTGLGAGIILDGRLRGGESSSEAGHMVLHAGGEPCPCGRRGCWEQYASATALIRRTEAAMAAHPESALCRLAEEAGGAVCMNAGAYGGEMAQVVREATLLLPEEGIRTLTGAEMAFGYRRSFLTDHPDAVVLRAEFCLTPGDPAAIRGRMKELLEKRRASQPLEFPSAGSTFKRPEGYYAGTLIDQCGLKGLTVGGAQVSE